MNAEHDRLVAKIQHFYDMLVRNAQDNAETAIISDDPERKIRCGCLMDEYEIMAESFQEIFKDFIYNIDGNKLRV